MFCPKCGNQLSDGAAFCGKCGTSINKPQQDNIGAPVAPKPQQNYVAPPVAKPAPRKIKEKKEKTTPSIFTKNNLIKSVMLLFIILLYAGTAFVTVASLLTENTVNAVSLFNEEVVRGMDLNTLLNLLVYGNRVFNPSAISLALGIWSYIIIYSIPVFALFAIIGLFASKKVSRLHIVFTFMSILSLITMFALSLAPRFIPGLKGAFAVAVGIITEDISRFTFLPIIIIAAIIFVLLVVTTVLNVVLSKKRRVADEKA